MGLDEVGRRVGLNVGRCVVGLDEVGRLVGLDVGPGDVGLDVGLKVEGAVVGAAVGGHMKLICVDFKRRYAFAIRLPPIRKEIGS